MIEVEQAIEKLRAVISPQQEMEIVDILDSVGRISAKDVYAKINVPDFPRSGMDGYAVRSDETLGVSKKKPIYLKVIGTVFDLLLHRMMAQDKISKAEIIALDHGGYL